MSPRVLLLASPFLLAVLLGLAVPNVDESAPEPDGPMTDFSMIHYRWTRRPLLVFSPSISDPRWQHLSSLIQDDEAAFEARDVVVIHAVYGGYSRVGRRILPAEAADRLREDFGVDPDTFAVVLVGKDGTEKARWDEPPTSGAITGLIDSMPMRQREAQAQPAEGVGD